MPRFLSAEWLAAAAASPPPVASHLAVLEQRVTGGPDGTVVYRVLAGAAGAAIVWPVPDDAEPPDLRITCDWGTAAAIASGALSTQAALMEGRLKLSGNPSALSGLAGADAVPAALRAETSYAAD